MGRSRDDHAKGSKKEKYKFDITSMWNEKNMAQMDYLQNRNRLTIQKYLMVPKENMESGLYEELGIKRYTLLPCIYMHV